MTDMSSTKCVLIVDDDDNIRTMLIRVMRRRGYSVREARNGAEAIHCMRAGDTDIVLLDLMMPVVTGWDVLRLRTDDAALRRIPVIVVTANDGPYLANVLDSGVCALLPKPFDIDALCTLVDGCLQHDHGQPQVGAF
jgi:CheY-like chemotaxis protein